jgi:4-cresol dehydrogenase (hydroxylating)
VYNLQFLDDRMIRMASRFSKPYSLLTGWNLERCLELAKPLYGLMKGIPTEQPLKSSYWRKRGPVPEHMDPDLDGCGLLWCAPIAPADGASISDLAGVIEDTILAHGFEPMISLTMITDRAVACVASISYDRDVAGQDQQAMACYEVLTRKLMDRGYYAYRLGIQSMLQMGSDSGYSRLLQSIKSTVDPNGILSPGRYQAESSVNSKATSK